MAYACRPAGQEPRRKSQDLGRRPLSRDLCHAVFFWGTARIAMLLASLPCSDRCWAPAVSGPHLLTHCRSLVFPLTQPCHLGLGAWQISRRCWSFLADWALASRSLVSLARSSPGVTALPQIRPPLFPQVFVHGRGRTPAQPAGRYSLLLAPLTKPSPLRLLEPCRKPSSRTPTSCVLGGTSSATVIRRSSPAPFRAPAYSR